MYLKLTEKPTETNTPLSFGDSLSRFVATETIVRDFDSKEMAQLLGELPVELGFFDPREHWDFQHIFSYESEGAYPFDMNKKQNCLFNRSGIRLYDSLESGSTEENFSVFEGFEVWLLDDMTFVTVSYNQVHIQKEQGIFISTYRQPASLSQFRQGESTSGERGYPGVL